MLSTTAHTYGPECSLQPESNVFTRRASTVSADAPSIRAQFFYSSPMPIDDPLSPVPPPSTKASTGPRVPPRPFSVADNKALEEQWQLLQNADIQSRGSASKEDLNEIPDTASLAASNSLAEKIEQAASQSHSPTDPHLALCDNPAHIPFDTAMPVDRDEIGRDEFDAGVPKKHRSPFHKHAKGEGDDTGESSSLKKSSLHRKHPSADTPYGSSPSERDTTGTPFLRVASRLRSRSRSPKPPKAEPQTVDGTMEKFEPDDGARPAGADEQPEEPVPAPMETESDVDSLLCRSNAARSRRHSSVRRKDSKQITVPVGVSRLHLVEMPALKMGPIYWDPVHDISAVIRGTWFYKDTMLPVPADVANQLEEGYEYMKPWTQTYVDELNSCLEIGAEAEMKIIHRLWPEAETQKKDSRPSTAKSKKALLATSSDQLGSDDKALKHAITQASRPENRAAGTLELSKDSIEKRYATCSVIYANARDAQILRPNQLPSAARGRKPLGAIRKGRSIGDPVVRGFDFKTWEKLHPPQAKKRDQVKDSVEPTRAPLSRAPSVSGDRRKSCVACMSGDERSKPTDLVLVIHGIGQKLSERVESFHFTHAINAFRRQINVELDSGSVKPWLRQDLGGIMVLPINWRATLKFEDAGPQPNSDPRDEPSRKEYTLKDITADSIPAVRNLISDVMLDIPYYLSHHKPRMIQAVVREANRVYRLWCKNNPGFHEEGRVHLIAHSLGSVMALDILSKQPTKLPKRDLSRGRPRIDTFEFDTKSLFFCGSPAGFFLLLNKAPLLPRRGRHKPDAHGEDTSPGVAGEAGTYGCLSVDNLYNVLHYNDPIAYRVNACVDVDYAYSLQPARVPSASTSWGQYFSSAFRSKPVAPSVPLLPNDMPARPRMNRLPTSVEMETHNFTQEELAEKRMLLLNDNGQIDFTLYSGGGPLEIQYLNMLSAHSSYWVLQDFVRFLVIEIGRRQGREGTVPGVRAAKKVWGKK